MRKYIKFAVIGIATIILIWVTIETIAALRLYSIRRHAQEVKEPFYTLVVDGKIVQHSHTVRFDRYCIDDAGNFVGYDDGRVEIPLLTVLSAIGATYSEEKNGVISIVYQGNAYFLIPERQAMYEDARIADFQDDKLVGLQEEIDTENLLLIWPEKKNGYFREECGEYIVDLSSLHNLCFSMGFTFDFDSTRGIVYFISENAPFTDNLSLPGH